MYLFFFFFVNPFELPYRSYDIQCELVDKHSMVSYFPKTLSLGCIFLICCAARICSFFLLFCCSNIVFSVWIFRNSVVGHDSVFRCCAMELVSERCIVCLLDRVFEVKLAYILLFSEIQSTKVHLNRSITLFFAKLQSWKRNYNQWLSWRF